MGYALSFQGENPASCYESFAERANGMMIGRRHPFPVANGDFRYWCLVVFGVWDIFKGGLKTRPMGISMILDKCWGAYRL